MARIDDAERVARRPRFSVKLVVVAGALVFGALFLLGNLDPFGALIGFAAIAGAALLAARETRRDAPSAATAEAVSPAPDLSLDRVIAAFPDPVLVVDRQGRVLAFNDAAMSLAPALRRGEPASIALRIPDVVDALRLVAAGGAQQRVEFSERAPSERWWECFVVPIGDGRHLLLAFHDLSPLRRVEEMRADFVANASHELRTPLAALRGFIETLQGPARDDVAARERFLEIMRTQATRMSRLIDDLLSLSRIELNAHVHPNIDVDVIGIVRQVVDSLQMLARERAVVVTVNAPSEAVVVRGNRDELTRLFENLIENALKYGASGHKVDIAIARTPDRMAEVSVRDFGPGIAAEYLPRLTERFYRVDVAESRAQGGTGLGLALVKHILNRHRGRLHIASRPGEGATFTVDLPLSAAPAAESKKE
ncbi:MAG: ATP-binding protein [Pseudorhodoplanes sp.]